MVFNYYFGYSFSCSFHLILIVLFKPLAGPKAALHLLGIRELSGFGLEQATEDAAHVPDVEPAMAGLGHRPAGWAGTGPTKIMRFKVGNSMGYTEWLRIFFDDILVEQNKCLKFTIIQTSVGCERQSDMNVDHWIDNGLPPSPAPLRSTTNAMISTASSHS